MDTASNNPKLQRDGLKAQGRGLAVFAHGIAILSVCGALYIGRFAFGLLAFGGMDDLVIQLFSFAAIFLITGFYWWRLARFFRRTAVENAKPKAE